MTVPSGLNVPGSYLDINNSRAIDPYGVEPFRVCIFGEHPEKFSGETIEYKRILSAPDAFSKYGMSVTYEKARAFFRTLPIGSNVEVYCASQPFAVDGSDIITLDASTITVPSDLKAGNITVIMNGESFVIAVKSTDTPTVIGDAIAAAALTTASVIQVTATTGVLSSAIASSNDGYLSDTIGSLKVDFISYDNGPLFEGASSDTITAAVTTTTNSVDLTDSIAVLPDNVINLFINPYTDTTNTGLVSTEITRRFGSTVQLEGHQIITQSGTASALITLMGSGGNNYNDQHLTVWDGGYNRPCTNYIQSASVAGLIAGSISEDPVVPMHYLDLIGMSAETQSNKRTLPENTALVAAGVAIGQVDTNGNVETLRITTTKTTTDGLSDDSYKDVNTIFTTSYLRQSLLRLMAIEYKNYKLADDGIRASAGQKIATPKRIALTILGWFTEMESRAIVENYDQFKTELSVTRDQTDKTRVNAIIPPDVVNQFRIFAGEIQFIL